MPGGRPGAEGVSEKQREGTASAKAQSGKSTVCLGYPWLRTWVERTWSPPAHLSVSLSGAAKVPVRSRERPWVWAYRVVAGGGWWRRGSEGHIKGQAVMWGWGVGGLVGGRSWEVENGELNPVLSLLPLDTSSQWWQRIKKGTNKRRDDHSWVFEKKGKKAFLEQWTFFFFPNTK